MIEKSRCATMVTSSAVCEFADLMIVSLQRKSGSTRRTTASPRVREGLVWTVIGITNWVFQRGCRIRFNGNYEPRVRAAALSFNVQKSR